MRKTIQLSDVEKCKILAQKEENVSFSEIARRIKRSKDCVIRFLKDPERYGQRFAAGRPPKLNERDNRRIFGTAMSNNFSAAQLKFQLKWDVSVSCVTRLLNSSQIFKYVPINKAPSMTKEHMRLRKEWVDKMIFWGGENWYKPFFLMKKMESRWS
jgi:hypothetical protein